MNMPAIVHCENYLFTPEEMDGCTPFSPKFLHGVLLSLAVMAFSLIGVTPTYGDPIIPVQLVNLSGSISSAGNPGSGFPLVDATNLFGMGAGTPVFLNFTGMELWTGSSAPNANQGVIDVSAGTIALDWAYSAHFSFSTASGESLGTAIAQGVLPTTGAFDFLTGIGNTHTTGFVAGDLITTPTTGPVAGVGRRNITRASQTFSLWQPHGSFPPPAGEPLTFDFFDPAPGHPEFLIEFPAEFGGSTQPADLTGSFTITPVPESSSIVLLASGCVYPLLRRIARSFFH